MQFLVPDKKKKKKKKNKEAGGEYEKCTVELQ